MAILYSSPPLVNHGQCLFPNVNVLVQVLLFELVCQFHGSCISPAERRSRKNPFDLYSSLLILTSLSRFRCVPPSSPHNLVHGFVLCLSVCLSLWVRTTTRRRPFFPRWARSSTMMPAESFTSHFIGVCLQKLSRIVSPMLVYFFGIKFSSFHLLIQRTIRRTIQRTHLTSVSTTELLGKVTCLCFHNFLFPTLLALPNRFSVVDYCA